MGIVLSAVISYAGIHEAIECLKHLTNGVVPNNESGFDDLVQYYTEELRKSTKTSNDWTTQCGQGYLCLAEDKAGKLKSAAVKYYHGYAPDSTAILFSTKISSFGDSVDEPPHANGDYRTERYSPTKTKTTVLNTTDTLSVANRNISPGPDTQTPANSFETDPEEPRDKKNKLTWQYTPIDSTPEINFESYDDDKPGFTDEFLRSLDGIKYRPLQRHDPSGRRRSFRKRRSSSSSSKDSRASRDEELKIFTSLEEAEFGKASGGDGDFGSASNLSARSSSRSRSRERRLDNAAQSADSVADDVKVKDVSKFDSLDEQTKEKEVIEEEDDVDFWGNSDD